MSTELEYAEGDTLLLRLCGVKTITVAYAVTSADQPGKAVAVELDRTEDDFIDTAVLTPQERDSLTRWALQRFPGLEERDVTIIGA